MTQHPNNLSPKEMSALFGKGLLMGGADVIPGVSGGTVALIVGIYQRLINAIKLWSPQTVLALVKGLPGLWNPRARPQLIAALHAVDFFFVLPLGAGVGSAIVVASKVIPQLLKTYPEQMNGFFFGLILVSTYVPFRLLEKRGPPAMVFGGVLCVAGLQSGGATGRINPPGPCRCFFRWRHCHLCHDSTGGFRFLPAQSHGAVRIHFDSTPRCLSPPNGLGFRDRVLFGRYCLRHHHFRAGPFVAPERKTFPDVFGLGRTHAGRVAFGLAIFKPLIKCQPSPKAGERSSTEFGCHDAWHGCGWSTIISGQKSENSQTPHADPHA